jgi:hypothetical protein
MNMFRLYLKILALNIGVSNFVVLLAALTNGNALKSGDFLFPAAIQFHLVTLIFIVLDLLRAHPGQAAALAHQPDAQPADERTTGKTPIRDSHLSRFSAGSFGAAKQN